MEQLEKIRKEVKDLVFAQELLDKRRTCYNCWHNRAGQCSVSSCECATDVFNHKEMPRRWASYRQGKAFERDFPF